MHRHIVENLALFGLEDFRAQAVIKGAFGIPVFAGGKEEKFALGEFSAIEVCLESSELRSSGIERARKTKGGREFFDTGIFLINDCEQEVARVSDDGEIFFSNDCDFSKAIFWLVAVITGKERMKFSTTKIERVHSLIEELLGEARQKNMYAFRNLFECLPGVRGSYIWVRNGEDFWKMAERTASRV